jgi:hypothetical protein
MRFVPVALSLSVAASPALAQPYPYYPPPPPPGYVAPPHYPAPPPVPPGNPGVVEPDTGKFIATIVGLGTLAWIIGQATASGPEMPQRGFKSELPDFTLRSGKRPPIHPCAWFTSPNGNCY